MAPWVATTVKKNYLAPKCRLAPLPEVLRLHLMLVEEVFQRLKYLHTLGSFNSK